MKYRWEIRTGDTWYAGTDANAFLSLSGDKGSMKEMELNDPLTFPHFRGHPEQPCAAV